MTSQQDTDFVKCIQGHCMHPEDPEVCWYERNWREICQTETDHDVINDILSARQDQVITSWKDKEVIDVLADIQIETMLTNKSDEEKIDDIKKYTTNGILKRTESLQSQGGIKLSKKEFVDLANEVKEIVDKERASDV